MPLRLFRIRNVYVSGSTAFVADRTIHFLRSVAANLLGSNDDDLFHWSPPVVPFQRVYAPFVAQKLDTDGSVRSGCSYSSFGERRVPFNDLVAGPQTGNGTVMVSCGLYKLLCLL
jgi:hypothetical protein